MAAFIITHPMERAAYLGTEVVMSPSPGCFVECVPLPFARSAAAEEIRSVKSSPAFVAARKRVLSQD